MTKISIHNFPFTMEKFHVWVKNTNNITLEKYQYHILEVTLNQKKLGEISEEKTKSNNKNPKNSNKSLVFHQLSSDRYFCFWIFFMAGEEFIQITSHFHFLKLDVIVENFAWCWFLINLQSSADW